MAGAGCRHMYVVGAKAGSKGWAYYGLTYSCRGPGYWHVLLWQLAVTRDAWQ